MSKAFKCDICGQLKTEESVKIEITAPKKWWDIFNDYRFSLSETCQECGYVLQKNFIQNSGVFLMNLFETLESRCPYTVCQETKAHHTFEEWNAHKQLSKMSRPTNSKQVMISGIAIGALIMSWTIIGIAGLWYLVFK